MNKKILSGFIACIAFINILCSITVYAGKNSSNFSDNMELLYSLGIISDKSAKQSEVLTRGEFVTAAVNIVGVKEDDVFSGVEFADCSSRHPTYKYMAAAYSLGLLYGDGEGNIRVDEEITQDEAKIILLRMIGYDMIPNFSLNLAKWASQSGISDGVTAGDITWEKAARMLCNAIDAPIMSAVSYGSTQQYQVDKEATVLTKYRDIYKTEGTVTGNSMVVFSGQNELAEGYVYIDTEKYITAGTNAEQQLGYTVTAYYHYDDENDKKTLLHISPNSDNNIKVLDAKDISGYEALRLTYFDENDRREYAAISSNAELVYNNSALLKLTNETVKIEYGQITLIDNDNDNIYDIVIISEKEICVVETVDAANQIVYFKFDEEKLNFRDELNTIITDKNGENISFSDLMEWDVLSICRSPDGQKITATYTSEEISGTVDNYSNDGDDTYVVIDGSEYRVSDFYTNTNQRKISSGDFYIFYLNEDGEIVASNIRMNSDVQYGFVIRTFYDDENNRASIKILKPNNEYERFYFNKSVKIDGRTFKDETDVFNALGGLDFKYQPIVYKCFDGKINYIDTREVGDEQASDSLVKYYTGYSYTGDGLPSEELTKLSYRTQAKMFEWKIAITADTLVCTIPDNPNAASEDDYKFRDLSFLKDDTSYCIEAYKTDEKSHFADLVVMYTKVGASAEISDTKTIISVVNKVKTFLDENDEIQYRLSFYREGAFFEFTTSEAEVIENITLNGEQWKPSCGDVIRLETNADDKITYCELLYSRKYDILTISNPSSNSFAAVPRFQLAYVFDKYGDNIYTTRIKPEGRAKLEELPSDAESHAASRYYTVLYDSEENTLRKASSEEIIGYVNSGGAACSKVFIDDRYGNPRTLVIYN